MRCPQFASASRRGGKLRAAIDGAVEDLRASLDGVRPDFVTLFVSPAYGRSIEQVGAWVHESLEPHHLVGTTGVGMLETAGEFEEGPSVALFAGVMPGARLATFEVRHDQLLTMEHPADLRDLVGLAAVEPPTFLAFADPFTVDAELLLARLEGAYPGAHVAGGLASGGAQPGTHVLFRDGGVSRFGAVGLAIADSPLRTVVSQGCRPVGRRFVVTGAERNKVLTLSGRPAFSAIQQTVADLSSADRELVQSGLLIGRVAHEAQDDFERGDFVVRNFVRFMPDEGAVVIADKVRVGQTVQLQLRDRGAASADLDMALARTVADGGQVAGGLVFTCAGRGRRLFGKVGHDVGALRRHLGDVPLAGFFCNGEIGWVGGANFVHGFTVSLALF